jgi:hypothetical protein
VFLGLDRACIGVDCSSLQACCLTTGDCEDVPLPVCELDGGIAQGPGTSCGGLVCLAQACCLGDGSCAEAEPDVCDRVGGTPQGPGTECASTSCATGPGAVPNGTPDRPGAPLRIVKDATPADIVLAWSPSCSPDATDYAIYEGVLGTWYSHDVLLCGTPGALTGATVTPGSGGRYFLVVPLTATLEGSYGVDALGAERPLGGLTCLSPRVLGCP